MISAQQLTARFASGAGVGPLSLTVQAGERVLIVGPSGCGKSTLLRLLNATVPRAFDADVDGALTVAGRDVLASEIRDWVGTIGVVAQDPESSVCFTEVADDVGFALENMAQPPARMAAAVGQALGIVGASHLTGRSTAELSGGELQRVAIAGALVAQPQLLLFDEPTSMLDAPGANDVVRALCELAARGATMLVVEHRIDEFEALLGESPVVTRWWVVGRDGRLVHDVASAEVDAAVIADVMELGCWVPLRHEVLVKCGDVAREQWAAAIMTAVGAAGVQVDATTLVDGTVLIDALNLIDATTLTDATTQLDAGNPATSASAPEILNGAKLTVWRQRGAGLVPVLREVSVSLYGGELVALVGANGSGKSTLLQALAQVLPVAKLRRRSVTPQVGARYGRVVGPRAGLIFQNPEHQFAAHTVATELAFGVADPSSTPDLLRWCGLAEAAEQSPYRLSGGQKRRLSVAAMLMHHRRFLLADEPTFGLDRHAAAAMWQTFRELVAEGRGVACATHDLRAVATWADRVLVMEAGELIADVTPHALLQDRELLGRAGLATDSLWSELAQVTADTSALHQALLAFDGLAAAVSPGESHA